MQKDRKTTSRGHRLSEYLQLPLESLAPNVPGETVTPLWLSVLLFHHLVVAFSSLDWFLLIPMSLCKSSFRRPVCSSNSGNKKVRCVIRLIPTFHLLSDPLPCSFCFAAPLPFPSQASLSLFLCGQIWPFSRDLLKPDFFREPSGLCLSLPLTVLSCPLLSAGFALC